MPLDVRETEAGRVLLVSASGPADYSEWVELSEREPSGQPRVLLIDARRRESLPTGTEAREEAHLAGSWAAVAIVTKEGAQYGMARVVAAIAEVQGTPVRVFTEMEPAREWLADHA